MQATHPPVQAIRSVPRNSRNTPTVDPADIYHVDIHTDPVTQKQFVLWDDIRLPFDDALHVLHQSRVVPFLKGDDFNVIKPLRIAAIPDVVLDVVVSGQLAQAEVVQSPPPPPPPPPPAPSRPPPSRLEQIEQEATRFPKYDSLAALRSRPSALGQTHYYLPSVPVLPRGQTSDPVNRRYSKKQALQIVKETMKKIAALIDLEVLHEKGDAPRKISMPLWDAT
ncbi:hypothetical protein BGX33_008303 [Mortierella sp. NVP41]|nr:hypothetical protein BGX33_008303 [Mortierella sp. NVP41]